MKTLFIALFLLIITILFTTLYYNNYIDSFAVFPGTTKVIARKKIAGTGVACAAGNCVDDPVNALNSTFNFPDGVSYSMASDSKGNIFLYDHTNKAVRKLIKNSNGTYGSISISLTTATPPVGQWANITIDNQDNIYLIVGTSVYKAPPPDSNNNSIATLINPLPSLISGDYAAGITTDGTNIYCSAYSGQSPFVVKLSPPTTGTTWTQQRLYPSTSTSGTPAGSPGLVGNANIYRALTYAKDRNELAFTTHNGYKIIIMRLSTTPLTTTTIPSGTTLPDLYYLTTTVSIPSSLGYGIAYNNGFYYIFQAQAVSPANTIIRINMSAATPTIQNFFGPSTTTGVLFSNTLDGVNGVGSGVGSQFAGCFDPSGALFVMDNTHTIVMIGYDSQTATNVTDVTDGTKVKMSLTDDIVYKAGINSTTNTNGKIKDCSSPAADKDCYWVDYDGTNNKGQLQINPCIERNALFNVNNTGPTNRCVVMNDAGPVIPVPEGKKGADLCSPTQTFLAPSCYNKAGFIDYGGYDPTLDPMPTIPVDKIAQLQRRKNMLATAGQLNMPKNTVY